MTRHRIRLVIAGSALALLAAVFKLATSRSSEWRIVIDEANSQFREGSYLDGAWQRSDPPSSIIDTVLDQCD